MNKTLLFVLLAFITLILWILGAICVQYAFPLPIGDVDASGVWARRGQFGDMFGSVTSLLTALNLCFLVFAIILQMSETRRLNEISKWQANYNYLLDAKKLIVDHPEVLELHGLSKDLPKDLGVSAAQVAYVVL